ncbi:DUF3472 domain-containing protein [Saccharicrinis sp. GN24d3]|uniref:DUF3472 domain-containing protein n=1 Tax=Saccharicrinis sp. GN24d3 TaxID=3458416 RepID=UPI00403612D0
MRFLKYTIGVVPVLMMFMVGCTSCAKEDTPDIDTEVPVVEEVDETEILKKELTKAVAVGGNSWVVNDVALNKTMITETGLKNWDKKSCVIRTFIRVNKAGKLSLGIMGRQNKGASTIKMTVGSETKEITLENSKLEVIPVARFTVAEPGYVQVDLQGVAKSDYTYGEVSHLMIGGEATSQGTDYVEDSFYWGRRGPSVHLNYTIPAGSGDAEWFYNEVKVDEGDDVVGSYFMANGFAEGYFGIQVNSPTERTILFSVWSPYTTDDPSQIPEDERIIPLRHGENVTVKEFGSEGSGGQSFRKYNWKAGNSYRFLLRAKPSENSSTDYTAYFYAPEIGKWELIASFRRPKTSTFVKRPHSFLENFYTEMGQFTRKAKYTNQWVCNTEGKWTEMTSAIFTADNTARKAERLDYAGGAEETDFFLKNCGFFNENTTMDSRFTRKALGVAPSIDFSKLP